MPMDDGEPGSSDNALARVRLLVEAGGQTFSLFFGESTRANFSKPVSSLCAKGNTQTSQRLSHLLMHRENVQTS